MAVTAFRLALRHSRRCAGLDRSCTRACTHPHTASTQPPACAPQLTCPPPPPPPTDFNLALDLGFLTKNRTYTFFKPKFIFYASCLSEKLGYWRYITVYRHLQRNPDNQLYPMFELFENWGQDENRHGDILRAVLKAQPELLRGLEAW